MPHGDSQSRQGWGCKVISLSVLTEGLHPLKAHCIWNVIVTEA